MIVATRKVLWTLTPQQIGYVSFILPSFLGWKRQWLRRHTINTEVFNNSYCADSNEPLICTWKTTLTLIYILPLRLESCVQLLLASHNLSGMSYFGGLGRNMLCNVSLSQGSKFLRPPAVSIAPCFRAGRIRTRLRLNSPIRGKLRASQTYFRFWAASAFCFSAPVPFPARRRKEALSLRPPRGGALREYLSPSPFLSQYSGRS